MFRFNSQHIHQRLVSKGIFTLSVYKVGILLTVFERVALELSFDVQTESSAEWVDLLSPAVCGVRVLPDDSDLPNLPDGSSLLKKYWNISVSSFRMLLAFLSMWRRLHACKFWY